jgi:hypothetical protein
MSAIAVAALPAAEEIAPWELHSELVLVSPEVFRRALELLPERDPDAFLARPQQPIVLPLRVADEPEPEPRLATAVVAYALWRLGVTARVALPTVAALVALATLVEVLH